MAIGDLFLVQAEIQVDDNISFAGFYYRQFAGDPNNFICQQLGNAWIAGNNANLRACLSTGAVLNCVYTRRIEPGPLNAYTATLANGAGTDASDDPLPANSCLIIRYNSNDPSGPRAGRSYISGVSKGQVSDGQFVGTFLSPTVQFFADNLALVQDSTEEFEQVIVQRQVNGVPQVPPNIFTVTERSPISIVYRQRPRTTQNTGYNPVP